MLEILSKDDLGQLERAIIVKVEQRQGGLLLTLEAGDEQRYGLLISSIQETKIMGNAVVITHRLAITTEEVNRGG